MKAKKETKEDKLVDQKRKGEAKRRKAPDTITELSWEPKTGLGKKVKNKEITDIEQILQKGEPILEKEIVEMLIPDAESELLMIGQSKGKFGGGQRRVFRQTQKKTREGNKPKFATISIVGNMDGIIGIGYGKAKETVPAREKAQRNAKLNIFTLRRGCGSWECGCGTPHSIPFKVTGKCGSCEITLLPAPKGTGLRVDKEIAKILRFAGITDIWSKTLGQTKTKINLIAAAEKALKKLSKTRTMPHHIQSLSIVDGKSETSSEE